MEIKINKCATDLFMISAKFYKHEQDKILPFLKYLPMDKSKQLREKNAFTGIEFDVEMDSARAKKFIAFMNKQTLEGLTYTVSYSKR